MEEQVKGRLMTLSISLESISWSQGACVSRWRWEMWGKRTFGKGCFKSFTHSWRHFFSFHFLLILIDWNPTKLQKIRGLSWGLIEKKRQENEQRQFLKVTIRREPCRVCNYVLEKVELWRVRIHRRKVST